MKKSSAREELICFFLDMRKLVALLVRRLAEHIIGMPEGHSLKVDWFVRF